MATAEQITDQPVDEGVERQHEQPEDQGVDAATSALTDTETSTAKPDAGDVDAELADTVVIPDQIRRHEEGPDSQLGDAGGDQAAAVEQHAAVQGEGGTGKSEQMLRTLGDMAQSGPEQPVILTTEKGSKEDVEAGDEADDHERQAGEQGGLHASERADVGEVAAVEEAASDDVVEETDEVVSPELPDGERGYGAFDAKASGETPHLDEAAKLLDQDKQFHAGLGDIGLKSAGILLGVGLVTGIVSTAALSGGDAPNQQTQSTEQVAAMGMSSETSLAAYSNGKLVEVTINPPANPEDDSASETLLVQAEVQGAGNMNGSPNGVPPKDYAVEAFATDELSGVPVPEDAKEQYVAAGLAQNSGGQSAAAYMKAADLALGVANQELAQRHGKIIVPVSESDK